MICKWVESWIYENWCVGVKNLMRAPCFRTMWQRVVSKHMQHNHHHHHHQSPLLLSHSNQQQPNQRITIPIPENIFSTPQSKSSVVLIIETESNTYLFTRSAGSL
mmetsp:Transcript_23989/g.67658  ORF Transcript_23989/g.67658 Transcript_23989/m.67658 type:complete len:105 (+) Transcript_23989:1630-1944(+)